MDNDTVSYELLRRLSGFEGHPRIDACVKVCNVTINLREPQYLDVKLAIDETVKHREMVRHSIASYRAWKHIAQGGTAHYYKASFDLVDGALIKRALQDRIKAYKGILRVSQRLYRTYCDNLPKNGWDKLGSWKDDRESE